MEPLTEFLRSLGVEFCADGRRRWSHDAKAYIVAETLKPGATVKAVAGKFGVNANRLSECAVWQKMGSLFCLPQILMTMSSLRLWFFVMRCLPLALRPYYPRLNRKRLRSPSGGCRSSSGAIRPRRASPRLPGRWELSNDFPGTEDAYSGRHAAGGFS